MAAAQEERFTRRKGDADFPARSVEYCLSAGGIRTSDLDFVGFYDKPLLKFERILETYLSIAPRITSYNVCYTKLLRDSWCSA